MVKLTQADLVFVCDEARKFLIEFPPGTKLDGGPWPTYSEMIAISYLSAANRLRAKIGDFEIEFVTPDSNPPEEDY